MARIRTIKPEFWQDEKLSKCDPLTRLVFLGLISQADDAGRLVDNVKLLDGLLFPETDDSCAGSLETLARLSRIIRYTSDSGQRLIQIANWAKHQRVDKPSKAVLPPPAENVAAQQLPASSRDSREVAARSRRESRAPTMDHGPWTNDQLVRLSIDNRAAPVVESLAEYVDRPYLPDGDIDRATFNAIGAPRIRKHWWQGRKPPAAVAEKVPKWNEGRELNIAWTWVEQRIASADVVLEFLRVGRGALGIRDGPESLLWLHGKSNRSRLHEALAAAAMQVERMLLERKREHGPRPTRLSDIAVPHGTAAKRTAKRTA